MPDIIPFARASNELLLKLLGPSADFLGERWRSSLEERAARNVGKVLSRAAEKVDDSTRAASHVPARVLQKVVHEAGFAEEEVLVEYLSGVLASSCVTDGDDSVAHVATIARLSSTSLRVHFCLYRAACAMEAEDPEGLGDVFLVNLEDVVAALLYDREHPGDELRELGAAVARSVWHAVYAMKRVALFEGIDLIDDRSLSASTRDPDGDPILAYIPNTPGFDLFSHAIGQPELEHSDRPGLARLSLDSQLPRLNGVRRATSSERTRFHANLPLTLNTPMDL